MIVLIPRCCQRGIVSGTSLTGVMGGVNVKKSDEEVGKCGKGDAFDRNLSNDQVGLVALWSLIYTAQLGLSGRAPTKSLRDDFNPLPS
eukprot:scaffold2034_cov113-Skeletonema_dohrnii-CCMP3373.AAC.17